MTSNKRHWRAPVAAIALTTVLLAASGVAASSDASVWRQSYQLEAKGQHDAAASVLEELTDGGRQRYMYTLRRAWLAYLAGRHVQAVAGYRAAVKAQPQAVEPRLGLMLPLMALRRWQETEQVGHDVLRIDPHNRIAKQRVALALYRLGRFKEAERTYREVLARYPSDVEMRAGIAWCLLRQGQKDEARRLFAEVLIVAPDNVGARAGIAAVK